jgi:hypothetical protein
MAEKKLHRQFEMKVALSLVAEINTVKFPQGFALMLYREVVGYQVNVRVLLQEKMPEVLEINPQSMAALCSQMLQQSRCVPIQTLQPGKAVRREPQAAIGDILSIISQLLSMQQGRGEARPC